MKSVEEKNEEFVLNILHDIKSPISGINIALRNIKFDNELLEEVYKVNKHNLDYIENLINNYSFKTGTYRLRSESCNLVTLLNEEIFALRFSILDKKLKLKLNYGTSAIPVYSDKQLLRRIILNLLTNSVKFSPEKSEIKIEIKKIKNRVTLCFTNSTGGKKPDSTGLGRGIVITSIEKLNGKIDFKKNEEKFTVTVEIPEDV